MVEKIKVSTIGGGTGSSTILKGLKKYFTDITAIVTVADDGGGSGMLREDLGVLPPGDIRSCLISLANTEKSMEKLMKYRFKDGILKGQCFGNLFIVAMSDIYKDFLLGIRELSNILALTGKVLPVTLEDITLFAKLEDGTVIEGESNISFLNMKENNKIERVYIEPEYAKPLNEVIYEIENSDIIILGPGSLYTSIIPNLIIQDIKNAICRSRARIYYVLNIMTQPGETYCYTVSDHLNAIIKHCDGLKIDTVIVNNELIPNPLSIKYKKSKSEQVLLLNSDREYLKEMGIAVIEDSLIKKNYNYIRHNENKLAKIILNNYLNKK